MRWLGLVVLLVIASYGANAQTETPTITPIPTETPTATPTNTPTPEPWVFATIAPESTEEPGQMTRFDYVATAGDVQISNLLTWILYTLWAMFLFAVLVVVRRK
jgi:hypothetical protein